jgi:transposase InsO family protein
LVRNGLVEPHARRRAKTAWRRWQRERPMQLWQMDVMGGLVLADGGEAKLVTGIDDHSRFCVAAGVIQRATARAVCRVFTAALARHGIPEELLTDNGKVFTGRFGPNPGEVLFDRICRENGIIHRLTAPRSPTTTGKIERFHQTLQTELLATLPPFPDLEVASRSSTSGSTTTTHADPTRPLGRARPPSGSSPPPGHPRRLSRHCWWPTSSAPRSGLPEPTSRRYRPDQARSPGWCKATASSP